MPKAEVAIPTPAEFVDNYPGFRPDLAVQGLKVPASEEMQRYAKLCKEVDDNMERQGFSLAVVINMQPFPLHVNGVLVDHMIVPACTEENGTAIRYFEGQDPATGRQLKVPYVAYLVGHYIQAFKDLGEHNFVPYAEPPLKLAYDFENEFTGENKPGGVFFYAGEEAPDHPDVGLDKLINRHIPGEGKVTLRQLFLKAYKQMVAAANKRYREAENEYAKPNGNRHYIGDTHRRAALILLREGIIAEKPAWMTLTRAESSIGEKCKVCKKDSQKGALLCPSCGYVFDVTGAYDAGAIDQTSTYMRRMPVADMVERDIDPAKIIPGYKPGKGGAAVKARPKPKAENTEAVDDGGFKDPE